MRSDSILPITGLAQIPNYNCKWIACQCVGMYVSHLGFSKCCN